jgi:6-phosphogluconolactonase (cycloisomerase 2 family)
MDSAGKFLFAADDANNAIASFTVNSSTGALTAVSNSPFTTGTTTEPVQLAVDASNSFVYSSDVASVVGGVSAFTLTSSGGSAGALTAVPGTPFTTILSGQPVGLATAGKFLYVSEEAAGRLEALSINNTGSLAPTPNSPYTTGNGPVGVVIAPSGKFLYVADVNDNTISGYTVDSTSGELTAMSNSPFATTASPWYLAIDPSGKFLYATNPNDGTITGFTIDSTTGALTQFSGAATAAGTQPVALRVVTVTQ